MRNAYLQMCDFGSRFRILKGGKISLVVSAFIAGTTLMHAAPTGGVVTSGTASIAQSGSVTNITQSTQKAAINWQGFSIGASEVVNFNQPNVSAITLNRVIGNEKSIIDGALNANGQVFILNSNGLLFSKNASINTAGLVATTMNLSDTDFMNGNYNFKGDSSASIINQGTINISDAGYAALFGKEVINEGIIKATLGKVHLTGASEVTLNLNGNSLVNLTVDKGVLDALVENKGAIYADGGEVYLTTNAVNELLKGVVNNTGIVEANSIDDITGKIEFFAHGGVANVSGTLNAEGGFIETSGEVLFVNEDASIKAKDWLLDPSNITISAAASSGMVLFTPNAGNWSSTLNVNTLIGALNAGSNITVTTANTPAGGSAGDITVAAPITWTSANKLTLRADNNIYINENITATNADGQLALYYGQSALASGNTATYTIADGKTINLQAGVNRFFTKLGSNGAEKAYTVITAIANLQGMANDDLAGNYVLGANIDASDTSDWNLDTAIYLGFTPIGNSTTAFSGIFDGLGHSISDLYINRINEGYLGLFGTTNGATIQNLNLIDVSINSENSNVGGLIGEAKSTQVSNVTVSGTVKGWQYVGGLIGGLDASSGSSVITNAHTDVAITGTSEVGGLIGSIEWVDSDTPQTNTVTITDSSAIGAITIDPFEGDYELMNIGGLVGYAENTQISNSFATGNIEISLWNPDVSDPYEVTRVGGLVGELSRGDITSSYATGDISIKTSYDGDFVSDVAVYEVSHIGGLVGFLPYGTITGTQEAPSYAEGSITIDLRDLSDNVRRVNYIGGLAGRIGVNYDDTEGGYVAPTADEKGQTINYAHASGAVHVNFGDGDYDYVEDIYGIGGLIGGVVDRNINNSYAIGSLTVNAWGDYDSYAYGGLIGEIKAYFYQDYLLISNSYYTTGTVDVSYYAGDIGGLVGYTWYTNIENSYATGNVIGRNDYDNDEASYRVGGLVGEFESGNIIDSYATGNVIGYGYVGGLVGDISDGYITANTSDVKATGSVSGNRRVGGLIGESEATVYEVANSSKIYATGVVTGEDRRIGGLIGESDGDTLIAPAFDRIYASNTVKGVEQIGGLVGYSYQSTYEYVNALTAIIANDDGNGIEYVGGLIGYSENDRLNQVKASGTMLLSTGNSLSVGGLIGFGDKSIIENATASVTFTTPEGGNAEYIGGLVGKLYGYIGADIKSGYGDGFTTWSLATTAMNAYITLMAGQGYSVYTNNYSPYVDINGDTYYYNADVYKENVQLGAIYNSYTATNVSGTSYVGGLVGEVQSGGHIEASYATGTVSGTNSVGGLVGAMINAPDTILNSYASGSVTGTDKVGGLVGDIFGSTITNSYAYGTVTGTTNVGGLVGLATTTTINDSYYDKTINSTLTENASNVGKTTAELQTLSTFSENWDIEADTELGLVYPRLAWKIDPEGNTYEKVWVIGQAPAGGGETPAPTPDVTSIVNGTSIQPPIIVLDTPRMEQFQTQPQRFNLGGQNFEFISTPMVDTPTQLVGMQEVRGMLGGGAGDIRIPLGQNSLIQLVNGGVRLPNGLEQEFFMAQR